MLYLIYIYHILYILYYILYITVSIINPPRQTDRKPSRTASFAPWLQRPPPPRCCLAPHRENCDDCDGTFQQYGGFHK